mmetsp:Transcript_19133/g.19868  ORF Transcript_19133/g.19868 Transcript_19133/m.19868 type:complete len:118 (-) Transcript_19133:34-387(-)
MNKLIQMKYLKSKKISILSVDENLPPKVTKDITTSSSSSSSSSSSFTSTIEKVINDNSLTTRKFGDSLDGNELINNTTNPVVNGNGQRRTRTRIKVKAPSTETITANNDQPAECAQS